MLQMLRIRRARKAAVAAIDPLVEASRWRFRGIPDLVWFDPYIIGFLAMLITLFAQKRVQNIGGQALGLVQLDAWEAITKTEVVNVGEEICLLSASRDEAFQNGCMNAHEMFWAIEGAEPSGVDAEREEEGAALDMPATSISLLWSQLFEERLSVAAGISAHNG